MTPELAVRTTPGAAVNALGGCGWRLSLPPGPARAYRWAQLDDYQTLPRARFRWTPPLRLSLSARVSSANLPGTWGFGFWNDPFSVGLGLGGMARRLPAPPDTAWFFYASEPNYLALRDDHPAVGFLAATFASARVPRWVVAGGLPMLPALLWRPTARLVRRLLRHWVREDAASLAVDPTKWHDYVLECAPDGVRFCIDQNLVWETSVAPQNRLGLVLWIDNQYAAFPPTGRLRFGTLESPDPSWLELSEPAVESG